MTPGDPQNAAWAHLAALRDVLERIGLSQAGRLDVALQLPDRELRRFLTSATLWGKTGSIVYEAGSATTGYARQECEEAFRLLGEWQLMNGYAGRDVEDWVSYFRGQRGLPQVPRRDWPQRPGAATVPWTVREVWYGLIFQAVMIGATWGVGYLIVALSLTPNLDLWTALSANLVELLLLVPVWWFVMHKHHGSLRSLGFRRFPAWVVGAGFGLLFAFFVFEAFYAALLQRYGLDVQQDITPLMRRLATPWPLFIAVAVVAPLVEETFFRGFMFAGLRTRYRWHWAAAITAALFAAAHLELTFFIPAFLLGFLFAYLFQRSNSVWPGIIIHAAMNTLAITVTYFQM